MNSATILPHPVSLKLKLKRMKQLFLSLVITFFGLSNLQAQAYEGTVEYNKKKQEAFLIEYNYPPAAVQNAIVKKMQDLGYKPKEEKGLFNKDKGFMVFKNAFVTEVNKDRLDYIVKVDAKGRKNQDESIVYLILQKDGFNAKLDFRAAEVDSVKTFLKQLEPAVIAENLELQIIDQEDAIAKAEKKLKGLKDDQEELEKKLKDNQNDQVQTEKEIEIKKQALDSLKSKRIGDKA